MMWGCPKVKNNIIGLSKLSPSYSQPTYNALIAFWFKVMMASVAASSATMLTKGKKTTRKKMVRKTDLFSQKSLKFEYLYM